MRITHSELVLLLQDTTREGTCILRTYLECQGCTVVELGQGEGCSIANVAALSHQHSRITCVM